MSGTFIVIDGGEGAGKDAHIKRLKQSGSWRAGNWDVVFTREPGGTNIGTRIREILLDPKHTEFSAEAELALFIADRAQHMQEVVLPALDAGKIVISNRGPASTFAYQICGKERHHLRDTFLQLNHMALGGRTPDLYVILDVYPNTGLARKRDTDEWTRVEDQDIAFHQRVQRGLLEHMHAYPSYTVVDANLPESAVWQKLEFAIRNYLMHLNG